MYMKKNIANIVTFTRIIGTCVMCFTNVLTPPFYIAYVYSGLSDVLDGFLARRLHIESDFGRKLDSISDLIFYTTMVIKIWPYMVKGLSTEAWICIWTIAGIRVALYIIGSFVKKEFLSNHTYLNKLTGFVLFFAPLLIDTKAFAPYCYVVIAIAFIAAMYEIILVVKEAKA